MSGQALDLKRSTQIVLRHKILIGIFAALGLIAGAGYAVLHPPIRTSNALVVFPIGTRDMATLSVIARSYPVLSDALDDIHPAMSLDTLGSRIQVRSLTGSVLSITGHGGTAGQAEGIANAVTNSLIDYLTARSSAIGTIHVRLLAPATAATGPSVPVHVAWSGILGALAGTIIGGVLALARNRGDRRLWQRDAIADAIGARVLASIAVGHPSGRTGWTRLIEEYKPDVVYAWSLRKALKQLGLTGPELMDPTAAGRSSISVLSLSLDKKALAIGPQLAAFAASLEIPTRLVLSPQQDENATASLRAACIGLSGQPPGREGFLQVAVSDEEDDELPGMLTIAVSVVDGEVPQVADTMRTAVTVLGVSAGAATPEQLARVAVSAASDGREIAGIIIADPDSSDQTTGRLPQMAHPAPRKVPTRLIIPTTETRR